MLELIQKLTREGCCAHENDILLTFLRHLSRDEVNLREMRIIDRQAVVILDSDTLVLSSGWKPEEKKGQ